MKLTNIILGLLLVLSMGLHAEEETVDVNFRDLSVKDFVEMVAKITHKNILIEGELNGKINFVSQEPIKKSSLMSLAKLYFGKQRVYDHRSGRFLQSSERCYSCRRRT